MEINVLKRSQHPQALNAITKIRKGQRELGGFSN